MSSKQEYARAGDADARSPVKYTGAIAVSAFCLNWIWEMAQMRAYANLADQPWLDTVYVCTFAAVGDVALTFIIYGMGALAASDWWWAAKHPPNAYAAGAVFGLLIASVIEDVAIEAGRWSYSDAMPMVPLLNAGLWPLLQLTLLVPISWWLANQWARKQREEH